MPTVNSGPPANSGQPAAIPDIAAPLLAWYDRHHRDLPWRTPPAAQQRGVRADPYHVWLSEIMLQQTTVEAVKPFFRAFLEKWPAVELLAAAPVDEVMKAWAGLGYYSRARNLHLAAKTVAARPDGAFPDTPDGLRALPGVGPYTAAAIAAIAFGRAEAVVDGNVERVTTRLLAIETPLPDAKPLVRAAVARWVPAARPGDFAQAMMDLGATVCTPRRPNCLVCPLREGCIGLATGDPARLPLKAPKAEKPARKGAAFVAVRRDGAVLLRRRPERGLLGGMTEVPGTPWTARQDGATGAEAAPFPADWRMAGMASHVFTHFSLELTVWIARVAEGAPPQDHWWSPPAELPHEALPTVMKKAIEAAIPGATQKRR